MAKFVTVKDAPTEISKDEYVIDKPTFLPEIEKQSAKAPNNKLISRNHLRAIVDAVGQVYEPGGLTGWVIKTHQYEGRPYADYQDLNKIVLEALSMSYPKIFDKYLDSKIKARPAGTKLIHFVDSGFYQNPEPIFHANGLDAFVEETAPKKVVGKPALTKEQAEQFKNKDQSNQ